MEIIETNKKPLQKEKPADLGSLEKQKSTVNRLWARMGSEFPNSWEHENGQSGIVDGEITDIAKNWLYALSKLDNDVIRKGMDDLQYLESDYAPSPTQFIRHCSKIDFENVLGIIFDYINRPPESDWEWTSQVAYNVFKRMQYNSALNENSATIEKRAKAIYRSLDRSNLDTVPSPMLRMPFKEPSKVDNEKRKFQAKMWFCIMRRDSSIISGPESPFAWIFNPDVSKQWMAEWYEQGQPEIIDFLRTKEVTI